MLGSKPIPAVCPAFCLEFLDQINALSLSLSNMMKAVYV
jgi:hypothetical protein